MSLGTMLRYLGPYSIMRHEAIMAEQLVLVENLVDDLLRAADEKDATRAVQRVVIGSE